MNKNHNKNMDDVWCCSCTVCAKVAQHRSVPRELATKRDYVNACNRVHARSRKLGHIKKTLKGKCDQIAVLGQEKTDLQQKVGSCDGKLKSLETEIESQKRANQDAVAAFRQELYVIGNELAEKVLEIAELKLDNVKVNSDADTENGQRPSLHGKHGLKIPQGKIQCDHSGKDSVLLQNASQLKEKDDFIDKFRDDLASKNDEIGRLTSDLVCIRNEFDRLSTLAKSKVGQNSSLHEKLKLKEDEINKSKQELNDNDELRLRLDDQLNSKDAQIEAKVRASKDQVIGLEIELLPKDQEIRLLHDKADQRVDEIMDLEDQISSKDARIKKLQEEVGNRFNDARVKSLESEISRTNTEVGEQIEKLTGDIKDRDASIRKLAKDTDLYAQALLDNDKYPKTLKDSRSNIKAANNIGDEHTRKLKKSITALETAPRGKDNIEDALAAKSNEVSTLQKALATKDNELESLQADLNRAQKQLKSFTPSPEQEAQATIFEIERDWEAQMAQLKRREEAKDEWTKVNEQLKAREAALKQVDEQLMAKQSETTSWKKRLLERDGDSADLEPSEKRPRPSPLILWTGSAIGDGDFC